jgi:hypothetical protein
LIYCNDCQRWYYPQAVDPTAEAAACPVCARAPVTLADHGVVMPMVEFRHALQLRESRATPLQSVWPSAPRPNVDRAEEQGSGLTDA